MKRFLILLTAALFLAAGCEPKMEELKVSPTVLNFSGEAGSQTLTVTSPGTWALKQTSGASWCSSSNTYGKGSMSITISVTANSPAARTAELVFSSSGCAPVTVSVNQEPGNSEASVEKGEFYPEAASGIEVDPVCPDADKPATIKFNPAADNALYGHTGELYGHLGVVVDGEWKFVPSEWGVADEKVHFKKTGDNSWELALTPSVREYFQSGETPINKIAIIVRSEDGAVKSHDADQFCSVTDNKYEAEVFTPDPLVTGRVPEGADYGINYNPDGSVTFVLYDQDTDKSRHEYCYIVGDWNEWTRKTEGAMKWDGSKGCWWITLSGFDADKEYRFQYRLGQKSGSDLYLSDPYTEIVYDPWNDQYIEGVPSYPEGAKQLVSAFQINRPDYSWQVPDFKVEDKRDLIIYEMLFRDFTVSQNIDGALAELDYIDGLGVNAVELMPIQEFDGNLSWGYDPNHWFALDKYYGTREEYKQFIDECHKRGIAVIVDVVYNHATGQHPWTKMFWNSADNCTAANNPWFNVAPAHPYNVFHDMNHENAMVKEMVKKSLTYLLEEYNVDGFRFDLTKGFTQTQTDPDVAAWSRYDQSRVNILKGYADHIWSVDNNAVVIFEHLSDWDEEKVLADHGIQLWRNVNHEYRSAVAGGSGNFSNMYSTAPFGGFVGYMESHDEERLCYGAGGDASSVTWGVIGTFNNWASDVTMTSDGPFVVARNVALTASDKFKIRKAGEWNDAYNYGAANAGFKLTVGQGYVMTNGSSSQDMCVPAAGTYDIYFCHDVETVWLMNAGQRPAEPEIAPGSGESPHAIAMRRAGASAAFFLMVPGPKMIWQFGEIGYDYSIEHNGRTGVKPVVTDEYMADPARKALYDTYAKLIRFRRDNPRFFDSDAKFEWTPGDAIKKITCTVDGKSFHVVGNFTKGSAKYTAPSGYAWKDHFTGESATAEFTLKEGEYRLLTTF